MSKRQCTSGLVLCGLASTIARTDRDLSLAMCLKLLKQCLALAMYEAFIDSHATFLPHNARSAKSGIANIVCSSILSLTVTLCDVDVIGLQSKASGDAEDNISPNSSFIFNKKKQSVH